MVVFSKNALGIGTAVRADVWHGSAHISFSQMNVPKMLDI